MGWATKQAASIVWHSFSPLSRIIIKANQDHQNWVSWEICSERNPFSSGVIMWHLKFWNILFYFNFMISYLMVTNHSSFSLTDPNSLITLLTVQWNLKYIIWYESINHFECHSLISIPKWILMLGTSSTGNHKQEIPWCKISHDLRRTWDCCWA